MNTLASLEKTPAVLRIDGEEHPRADDCWCRPRLCPRCGKRVHRQTIYGPAFAYQCEGCEYEPNPEMDFEYLPRADAPRVLYPPREFSA